MALQQDTMTKTLTEQSTTTHSKLSDTSRSQYELSRSQHELSRLQTLLQSRLAKLEETLIHVVTGTGENDSVSSAASIHAAVASTTRSLAKKPPFVIPPSSVLVSCSLLELNPPVLRRSERLKEKERRKTEEMTLNVDSETHAVSLEPWNYEKTSFNTILFSIIRIL